MIDAQVWRHEQMTHDSNGMEKIELKSTQPGRLTAARTVRRRSGIGWEDEDPA